MKHDADETSGEEEAGRDLLASRFVKGSYCAYPFILTVVVTGIGQLIATLVLEPRRAAARHFSEVRTAISERKNTYTICTKANLFCSVSHAYRSYVQEQVLIYTSKRFRLPSQKNEANRSLHYAFIRNDSFLYRVL